MAHFPLVLFGIELGNEVFSSLIHFLHKVYGAATAG